MKNSRSIFYLFIFLLSFSCSEDGSPVDWKAEIIKASDEYTEAIAAVDADKMLSFWAEEMIIFRPEGDDFVGKKSFSEFVRKFYDGLEVKDVQIHSRTLKVSAGLGVETVDYSESIRIDEGDWLPVRGRYLAVWQKDGQRDWKIIKMVNLPGNTEEPADNGPESK